MLPLGSSSHWEFIMGQTLSQALSWSPPKSCGVGPITSPIFQTKKPRLWKMKSFVQVHTQLGRSWHGPQTQDWLTSKPMLSPQIVHLGAYSSLFNLEFWDYHRLTGSFKDTTQRSCVAFIQFPPTVPFHVMTVLLQNQNIYISTSCV